MRPADPARICCFLVLFTTVAAIPARAQSGMAPALDASGNVSTVVELTYPRSAGGGFGDPAVGAAFESELFLSGTGPSALFRLRALASASADEPSAYQPTNLTNAVSLDIREAEITLLLSPALSIRAGMLLRSLGLGSYGSPADPFARLPDQGGFWGASAEWAPIPDFSAIALASADRAARDASFAGVEDIDAGAVIRLSAGALDTALGAYGSGYGNGEARPVAYVSYPAFGFLGSLEAALSIPLGGAEAKPSESCRLELRRGLSAGELSFELAAAYRGVFPGRSQSEFDSMIAALAGGGLPGDPFAPYYGRHYTEFSVYVERPDLFSFSGDFVLSLPVASMMLETEAELYSGDAGLFVKAALVLGAEDGEFRAIARATGTSELVIGAGLSYSF